MLYALSPADQHWTAAPGRQGRCPACASELLARCGAINVWHWAHRQAEMCDAWYEPETAWHLAWKSRFPATWVEIPIERAGQKHIADVRRPDGLVIEFQHSPISPTEIAERESFYGRMIWIFDISDCTVRNREYYGLGSDDYLLSNSRFDLRHQSGYSTFRWRHPRKHIAYAAQICYLDLGQQGLFLLKKMHIDEPPYGGWGYLLTAAAARARLSGRADD